LRNNAKDAEDAKGKKRFFKGSLANPKQDMATKDTQSFRARAFGLTVLIASLLATIVTLSGFKGFEEIEYRTWDWRLEFMATPPRVTPLRIITIDQPSLDYLAREEGHVWPWPRGVYEAVLQYLKSAGAKAVAFDILLTEPSSYGVDDDDALGAAVKGTLPVVSALTMTEAPSDESEEDLKRYQKKQPQREELLRQFKLPPRAIVPLRGVTLPIRQLIDSSAMLADVKGEPDSDGNYRHIIPAAFLTSNPELKVLRLPFALYSLAFPGTPVDFTKWVDAEGRLTIRYVGPKGTIPTESFANVYLSWQNLIAETSPKVPLANFKDAVVLIGMDAPGLLDLRPTPLAPNFPGVELNATVIQNLLDHSFIRKPERHWVLLGTILAIGLVAAVSLFLSGPTQVLSIILLFSGYLFASFAAAEAGWWIPFVTPALSMVGTLLASLTVLYVGEGRQRRFLKDAFRFYVSPSIIDRIVEDPRQLELGGERRELTIFFSDIVGFTTISETLEAGQLVSMLNTYLSNITEIILRYGGTVDKYVGDAVVAFWNAPLSQPDHAERAVGAALEVQAELLRLQVVFERDYKVTVKTRIGLNTGMVSVGNFGSSVRFSYTVIGDAANLASRLEGANKYLGSSILMSGRTFKMLGSAQRARSLGTIKVVGKTHGVPVYEPLGESHPLRTQPEKMQTYEAARVRFERGEFDEARELFEKLPEDSVSAAYLRRIAVEGARKGLDWSPEWNLTEK
jgi:adenylate cyclase